MKKLVYILLLAVLAAACSDDKNVETMKKYKQWYEDNNTWVAEQAARTNPDGTPYFQRVSPSWQPGAYVLMHWFGDQRANEGNLVPLYTSKVSTIYHGRLYNDVAFDSSYAQVDSLSTFAVSGVIAGWQIALQNMHVGDSVLVVIPQAQGYGPSGSGSIPPYSALQFSMKLVDIPTYEIK